MSGRGFLLLAAAAACFGSCSTGAELDAEEGALSVETLDAFMASCGNGVCGGAEDCGRCPTDCGECAELRIADGALATDPIMVGAGDMADCSSSEDTATAALLDDIPGTVFTVGDNAYEHGTTREFNECYEPTWGRHRLRTRPVVGNHEYATPGASGYYGYFGEAAGKPNQGWYSYDVGTWHVVALNSMCEEVGGCGPGSAQEQWLRADLAANPTKCTMAIFHHPLFSSGEHGAEESAKPLWSVLYELGADLIVNGHEHNYERFAPQDPSGNLDRAYGIREFVIGMGGRKLRGFEDIQPNSEARDSDTYGVMKFQLHPEGYSWEFVAIDDEDFEDSGSEPCHDAPQL